MLYRRLPYNVYTATRSATRHSWVHMHQTIQCLPEWMCSLAGTYGTLQQWQEQVEGYCQSTNYYQADILKEQNIFSSRSFLCQAHRVILTAEGIWLPHTKLSAIHGITWADQNIRWCKSWNYKESCLAELLGGHTRSHRTLGEGIFWNVPGSNQQPL